MLGVVELLLLGLRLDLLLDLVVELLLGLLLFVVIQGALVAETADTVGFAVLVRAAGDLPLVALKPRVAVTDVLGCCGFRTATSELQA